MSDKGIKTPITYYGGKQSLYAFFVLETISLFCVELCLKLYKLALLVLVAIANALLGFFCKLWVSIFCKLWVSVLGFFCKLWILKLLSYGV